MKRFQAYQLAGLTALMGTITVVHAQSACAPLPAGVVSYWPANGNAQDLIGGNNGTLTNGVTYTNGETGQAFYLNNSFESIRVGVATNLHLQNFTIEGWIKRNNTTDVTKDPAYGGNSGMIFGCSSLGYGFVLSSGNVLVLTRIDSNETDGSGTITDTNFHHVAVTKNGGSVNFYIDGAAAGTENYDPGFTFSGGASIGSRGDNLDCSFDGEIDDLAIYNRALAAGEIQSIYEAGSAGKCGPEFRNASATPDVVNGFVVGANITDSGFGYTNTPLVAFQGGSGTGAAGTAVVSNELVTSIVITDPGTGYTNPPLVWIGYPPLIESEPAPVLTQAGSTASFSIEASGSLDLQYQWDFNGTNIPGATSASIVISNVTPTNLGVYSVTLSSVFGVTNSVGAALEMYPKITNAFTGLVTLWGGTNTLSVGVEGSSPLTFQWLFNGAPISGATNSTLTFDAIQFTNAGLYSVVVGNPFGSVTNIAEQVVVNPAGVSIGTYPGISVTGTVGYTYEIERTADLGDTNSWTTVANVTLGQSTQLWVDTNIDLSVSAGAKNYYRVVPSQ